MRTPLSLVPTLAAAVLAGAALAAARPVSAQTAATAAEVRPATPAAVRTVAVYTIVAPRAAGLPTQVVVADSAGTLVASFRPADARDAAPVIVTVLETDLVLQGEVPAGVLTLRLFSPGDPAAASGPVTGRWWLGSQEGELRRRGERAHAAR
jgi:hypothetical protein